tara:strand:- start:932 stop:1579 length:648 start_codon:yes stop_codon:yes gene_type:complete
MGDADKNNLFPEINPNINEIIENENMLDSGNVIKNEIEGIKQMEQDDIFDEKPKKKYEHLDKARLKGAEVRKQKAEEKRIKKAEEKEKKDEEKRLRREATAERNRVKARERYYKQREQKEKIKKEIPKKIIEETKPKQEQRNYFKEKEINSQMDFNTFAKYMMEYETLKDKFNKQYEEDNKPKQEEKPKEKDYHPKNYPLSHLYHKDRKRQFTNF